MPTAIQSQVRPTFCFTVNSATGHDRLIFALRDLLRRHSILHERSHTRLVVSCNACRANKTKCSGGTPCSLCTRRGINCIFRSRPNGASTSEEPLAINASSAEEGENYEDDDRNEPAPLASSSRKKLLTNNTSHSQGDMLSPTVKIFQSLKIVPPRPVQTSNFHPLSHGIQAIYELLIAQQPSLEGAAQVSDELEAAVTKYFTTYSRSFHLRWPILHMPSFDVIPAPLPLAASVCVIGAFQSSTIWSERFYTLKVHEILLQRLLHDLVRTQ